MNEPAQPAPASPSTTDAVEAAWQKFQKIHGYDRRPVGGGDVEAAIVARERERYACAGCGVLLAPTAVTEGGHALPGSPPDLCGPAVRIDAVVEHFHERERESVGLYNEQQARIEALEAVVKAALAWDGEGHAIGPCEVAPAMTEWDRAAHFNGNHHDTCAACHELWPCRVVKLRTALAALDKEVQP